MKDDQIKDAFKRAKNDIDFLGSEISQIKQEIREIKHFLDEFATSTIRQINTTHSVTSTDNSTHPQEIEGLKASNSSISTGNEGASTDRQTDRQTDNSTQKIGEIPQKTQELNIEQNIQKASDILGSLDQLKKEIRLKFKLITPQEMSVFSTIYQLEEQKQQPTTYQEIAQKLGLSQSSIRDYTQRMINKGIPIKKQKIGNKKIVLSISKELKKIATLNTILQLREL
jgi:DNA-binding MarR family transcriptional regulator